MSLVWSDRSITPELESLLRGYDYQKLKGDQKTQSAVIMQLALIGELAKKISSETQSEIDLPWKDIAGFRDRAIHDYFQIDLEIVWETIESDLQILEKEIKKFLEK